MLWHREHLKKYFSTYINYTITYFVFFWKARLHKTTTFFNLETDWFNRTYNYVSCFYELNRNAEKRWFVKGQACKIKDFIFRSEMSDGEPLHLHLKKFLRETNLFHDLIKYKSILPNNFSGKIIQNNHAIYWCKNISEKNCQ